MVTAWRRMTAALAMTVSGGCDPDTITGFDEPPDLVIRTADETIELEPHSFSTQDMVADRTVVADGGVVDLRGPAVFGKKGERFPYLTWGDVGSGGSFARSAGPS